MHTPDRRPRTVIAVAALAGLALLAGCSRFHAERAQCRHDAVTLRALAPVVADVPVD